MVSSPDRGQVAKVWGFPTEQIGSVNDPRDHEECGVTWNEKWVYQFGDGSERWVFWRRYDFVGAFRTEKDGSCAVENLPK